MVNLKMLHVCISFTHCRIFLRCIQWDKNIQTQARGQESYTSHYFGKERLHKSRAVVSAF